MSTATRLSLFLSRGIELQQPFTELREFKNFSEFVK